MSRSREHINAALFQHEALKDTILGIGCIALSAIPAVLGALQGGPEGQLLDITAVSFVALGGALEYMALQGNEAAQKLAAEEERRNQFK